MVLRIELLSPALLKKRRKKPRLPHRVQIPTVHNLQKERRERTTTKSSKRRGRELRGEERREGGRGERMWNEGEEEEKR